MYDQNKYSIILSSHSFLSTVRSSWLIQEGSEAGHKAATRRRPSALPPSQTDATQPGTDEMKSEDGDVKDCKGWNIQKVMM